MTDQTHTTETPDGLDFEVTHIDAPEDQHDEQPEPDPEDTPATEAEPGPEESKATRLRKRAQDAERERDALREQLDAARRALVESTSRLPKPAALWAAGTDLNALFTTDGTLDRAALDAAISHTTATLGIPRSPKPDLSAGASPDTHTPYSWSDVLS